MNEIYWTALAREDLRAVYDYISIERPLAASSIIQNIVTQIGIQLATYPESGRIGRVAGTRELIISGTPFIIPYQVNGKRINILRIYHTSRTWPHSFR